MDFKNYILWLKQEDKIVLKIKVTSSAKNTEIFDLMDDHTLKIRVKSVREKWKANKELISFLSDFLSVKLSQISIISWITDNNKKILIDFSEK